MSETGIQLPQFFFFFVLPFFVLPGCIAGWIASSKGRSMLGWFLLCLCFPPCLMVIIFQNPLREVEGHYRRCPACSEMQAWKLPVCKYCGAEMAPTGEGR